jgi:hypothetical protein
MTTLWKKWTLNCAAGEVIGIASAGLIAYLVNTLIGEPTNLDEKLLVLVAMLLAGFVEGGALAWFQYRILRTKFTSMRQKEWMFYTVLVAVLGWFWGMLPSLFLIPQQINGQGESNWDLSNPFLFSAMSIGMGLVLGAIFGIFQWFPLRKHAEKAYLWIIANALGWGLGLAWIFTFASIPTEESSMLFVVLMGAIGGILAGLSLGAVTGYFLERLTPKSAF